MTQTEKMVVELGMLYPFDQKYPITSTYQDHLNDTQNNRHLFPGTDYGVYYGSPIAASIDGSTVGWHDGALGNDIVFLWEWKGKKWRLDYCHLSWTFLGTGSGIRHKSKKVKKGTAIGKSGNTGFVLPPKTTTNPYSGTHVHVSLRECDAAWNPGKFHDPTHLLDAMWRYKAGTLKKPVATISVPDLGSELEAARKREGELLALNEEQQKQIHALTNTAAEAERIRERQQNYFLLVSTMQNDKTMWEAIRGGAKFWGPSVAIATAITIALGSDWTATEAAAVTGGLASTINLMLSVVDNKLGWW